MSFSNGNGNGHGNGKNGHGSDHHPVVLTVEDRTPEGMGLELVEETVSMGSDDDAPVSEDMLYAWKKKDPSIENLQEGLIAVATLAEAAVKDSVTVHAELRARVVPTLDRVEALSKVLAVGLESTSRHTTQVDGDLADAMIEIKAMHRDVQFLKDDVAEMKPNIAKIPAILEILGEILGRLPDPSK